MVFVGDRGAEESHDAVARELVDGAFVAVDVAGQDLEAAVHDLVDGFGVETLREGSEAGDVREKDGDLFALAFESAARRQDLLGQVRRRIRAGSGLGQVGVGGPACDRQALAAAATELVARLIGHEPTARARRGQLMAAARAEPPPRLVLNLTLGTLHVHCLPRIRLRAYATLPRSPRIRTRRPGGPEGPGLDIQ
jgi:hypothetical protein